jgi:putative spermidine/putrescine transport system ATP-binding protein
VEQVGTPREIYQRPANDFVAGFVGTSNIIERNGDRYAVRPEKIRLLIDGEAPAEGAHREAGVVREVVYLGAITRYVVELEEGETLVVVRQNLDASAEDALEQRGQRVWLAWRPQDASPLRGSEDRQEEEARS